MAGHSTQHGPCRHSNAENGKKQVKGLAAKKAPPPEEEDPRVKCKDCGAFGHNRRSIRCPMKRWQGAIAPLPLGSRIWKENVKPGNLQVQRNPGLLQKPEREKEQRQRQQEQHSKALLQRFPRRAQGSPQTNWKELTGSCGYVRHAKRPTPLYRGERKSALGLSLTCRPPSKTPDMRSSGPAVSAVPRPELSLFSPRGIQNGQEVPVPDTPHAAFKHFAQDPTLIVQLRDKKPHFSSLDDPQAPSKKPGLGHALNPQPQAMYLDVNTYPSTQAAGPTVDRDAKISINAPGKRPAQVPGKTFQTLPKKPRLSPFQDPKKSTQSPHLGVFQNPQPPPQTIGGRPTAGRQVTRKMHAQGKSIDLPPPRNRPHLNTAQNCTVAHGPALNRVPGQPLRMLFRRLDNGWWSSRLLTAPSCLPAEKTSPPGQSPPTLETPEGHCARVPLSVLENDLQVSSSSEETDWEGDTSC